MERRPSPEGGPTSTANDMISLPFDVLLRIVLNLDPPDILQLRQTCTKLCSLTKEKITWIRALRLACLRHGIAYPLHAEKTSTTEELEHAVMCHYKFAARLRAEARSETADKKLKPLKIRELQPLDGTHIIDGNPFKGFRALALIPGGRFLVTIGFGCSLQLWDICAPDLDHHGALKAEVGIPLREDQSNLFLFDVKAEAVSRHGVEKIMVVVVIRVRSDCFTGFYFLYSAEPASDVTRFKEVGRLPFRDEAFHESHLEVGGIYTEQLIPQRNYLVMSGFSIRQVCDLVWTWNYEEDTLSILKVPPRDSVHRNSHAREITMFNDHIVVCGHNFIESYKLPPFYPRSSRPLVTSDPTVCLSRTVLENNFHYLIARSISYHDPVDDLLIFHQFGPESEDALDACYFLCYTSSFPHANTSPGIVEGLQTSQSSWSSHHFQAANCDRPPYPFGRKLFHSYKLPYHDQALMWMDSQHSKISFKVLNDGREADIQILSRSRRSRSGFRFHYMMDKASISFCPFSGRLCYIGVSKEFGEDLGGPMIYVVDYV